MFITKKSIALLVIILCSISVIKAQDLVINEIMSSNSSILMDEDGEYSDWIEIYNASAETVTLTGFGLSDDREVPFQWEFPVLQIQSGDFIVVWASGKDRKGTGGWLHTNFSLNSSGETLLLSHSSGTLLDSVAAVSIPADISYGRKTDATTNWYFFNEPTPACSNTSTGFLGVLDEPVFSHTGGFYTDEFQLNISSTETSANIHYTLDGSIPDLSASIFSENITIASLEGKPNDISNVPTNNNNDPGPPYYEGWQPPAGEVFKVNVVRAQAVKQDYLPSKVVTHSYLVHPLGKDRYTLPVFFINTNREHFFDPETGIYIPGNHDNMYQKGPEWERPVHLSLFEKDGLKAWSGNMGIRLHGGTTRSRPRKSLRLYARDEYGKSWMNYRLFPNKEVSQYKRFLLRNSGNDWDQSIFRDGFMQYLAKDLNVETQHYRPAIVFLNGEYWGIHGLRDRYDEHYMFSHYGLEEDEMTILENNSVFAYGNPAGVDHYSSMLNFINNANLAAAANYGYVKHYMDVHSFIDFQIANIYVMNTDWPGNNFSYSRRMTEQYIPEAPPGLDGRWRWHMRDTDFGFWLDFFYVPGVDQGAAHNTLAFAAEPNGPGWPNPSWSTFLLRKLLTNTKFKNNFINRFADLLNTTMKDENVIAVIDSIQDALQPEMQEHIDRWRRPVNMNEWLANVDRMRSFALQRTNYQRQHIQSFFSLDGQYDVSLSVNDHQMGSVRINTIEPTISMPWTGIYFKGIPVEIQAMAKQGYRFTHWSGSNNSSHETLTLNPANNIFLTAHFEVNPDFAGDELNPPAFDLTKGHYAFTYWDENQPEDSFPPHMMFLQSSTDDPLLSDEMTHRYHVPLNEYHADDAAFAGYPYKLNNRTRINGLAEEGISFINSGRGRDLGATVLAIDTRGLEAEEVTLEWTSGTITPNARVYAIRMQYKIGPEGVFKDYRDENGNIVEYKRSDIAGHEQKFGPYLLPEDASNQEYVQLRWKYYYTGELLPLDHGRRDLLRLDDIRINNLVLDAGNLIKESNIPILFQNHPNPTQGITSISFTLPQRAQLEISLFDATGKKRLNLTKGYYNSGTHTLEFNLEMLEPGLYFYRMTTGNFYDTKRIILLN